MTEERFWETQLTIAATNLAANTREVELTEASGRVYRQMVELLEDNNKMLKELLGVLKDGCGRRV